MTVNGSCHCGKVAFEINAEIPEALTRCTCSFCAKRGTLYAYFEPALISADHARSGHGDLPLAIKNGGA